MHHLVLRSTIDEETLTIGLRAALSDLHIGYLLVLFHQISEFLAIRLYTVLRHSDTLTVPHVWRALLVALVIAESTELMHV